MADQTSIEIHLPNNVSIRQWRQTDVESSTRHLNNRKVWDNLRDRIPHPYTEADAEQWVAFCQCPSNHVRSGPWTSETGSQGQSHPTNFAITVDDQAVGGIGLDFQTDVYFRTAEIGYWLGEAYWGQGIMTVVVRAFVGWAWETFGILVRISAETVEGNAGSARVLEKAGFEREGRREDMVWKNGRIRAVVMWGALRRGLHRSV